ncbi:MAG: hypothetical protein WCV99_02390 [Sterolibacterium sp.]|jgi:mono/diheme cytochrome c family protein
MKLLAALLLLFGISGQLQAAIEAVYDGDNGIRNRVLTVCMQCHSSTLSGGARNGAPSPPNFNTYAGAVLLGDYAVERAIEGSMPPQGNPRLNAEQQAALLAWQAAGFPEKSATPSAQQQSDCLFNWAELSFPEFFAPRAQSVTAEPIYYRYYTQSTAYLAITASRLYYLGPVSAGTVADLGEVATWHVTSGCN